MFKPSETVATVGVVYNEANPCSPSHQCKKKAGRMLDAACSFFEPVGNERGSSRPVNKSSRDI